MTTANNTNTEQAIKRWVFINDEKLQARRINRTNVNLTDQEFVDLIEDVELASTYRAQTVITYKFRNNPYQYEIREISFAELIDQINRLA